MNSFMEQHVDSEQSVLHCYDAAGVVEPLGIQWFYRQISHYDLCLLPWRVFPAEHSMNCHNVFLNLTSDISDIKYLRW